MSQFMVKSLEELEAYLVEECQRSECKFLSDNQNNNFPLTRKALEDTRRIHIDKPVTTYVQNLNDRRPRRCTCTPSTLSITVDHERDLWKKGVLGIDECFALLRTFHFYVSKCFGIRGRAKTSCSAIGSLSSLTKIWRVLMFISRAILIQKRWALKMQ